MSQSRVVAKRYKIWVDKFSELVTEKQKEINKISELEPLYIIAKDVMEEANIKNDNKISLYGDSVFIEVNLIKEDKISSYYPVAEQLKKEFERKRIELFVNPTIHYSEQSNIISWRYIRKFKDRHQSLFFHLHIPHDGTNEILITRNYQERKIVENVVSAFWIGEDSSIREDLNLKIFSKDVKTTEKT